MYYQGILPFGPPNCVTMQLAKLIAERAKQGINASSSKFYSLSRSVLGTWLYEEILPRIRNTFLIAKVESCDHFVVIFLDDLNDITMCSNKTALTITEEITHTLCASMDMVRGNKNILLVGTIHEPTSLPPELLLREETLNLITLK